MASDSRRQGKDKESDPLGLRGEFVGFMFALAVGDVGLQTAALVQAGHHFHYLPAYSHLLLALIVIAASWVGWSRTQVTAAKRDVAEIFEWPFVVLLLDTAMVVFYFILVRTVDFSDTKQRIDSAEAVARWHVWIFVLYLAWDLVTKVAMYKPPPEFNWVRGLMTPDSRRDLVRIVPTLVCLVASWILWRTFAGSDYEHLLTADLALLSMVLLFRALKSWTSAIWPAVEKSRLRTICRALWQERRQLRFRTAWCLLLTATLAYGTWATIYAVPLPLPDWVIKEMRTPIARDAPVLAKVPASVPMATPVPGGGPVLQAPSASPPGPMLQAPVSPRERPASNH